jgi:hypothetical protein
MSDEKDNVVDFVAKRHELRGDVATYALQLSFDTDHPEFARGFEAGMLLASLKSLNGDLLAGNTNDLYGNIFHKANRDMVKRIAAVSGFYIAEEGDLNEEWFVVKLRRKSV